MRNGTAMIARFGSIRGFDPSLTLTPEMLGSVTAPTRFLIGDAEPIEVVRAAAALMPNADLQLVPRGGHLPWLDDPDRAAKVTESFLLG